VSPTLSHIRLKTLCPSARCIPNARVTRNRPILRSLRRMRAKPFRPHCRLRNLQRMWGRRSPRHCGCGVFGKCGRHGVAHIVDAESSVMRTRRARPHCRCSVFGRRGRNGCARVAESSAMLTRRARQHCRLRSLEQTSARRSRQRCGCGVLGKRRGAGRPDVMHQLFLRQRWRNRFADVATWLIRQPHYLRDSVTVQFCGRSLKIGDSVRPHRSTTLRDNAAVTVTRNVVSVG